jgi:hypothetical protein
MRQVLIHPFTHRVFWPSPTKSPSTGFRRFRRGCLPRHSFIPGLQPAALVAIGLTSTYATAAQMWGAGASATQIGITASIGAGLSFLPLAVPAGNQLSVTYTTNSAAILEKAYLAEGLSSIGAAAPFDAGLSGVVGPAAWGGGGDLAPELLEEAAAVSEPYGPWIGRSGYRTAAAFSEGVASKYQQLYDQGYASTMALVSQRMVANDPLIIGSRVDAFARYQLRDWLSNFEGIEEGPGKIIQANRRLYDPLGSGAYRIPDVYILGAGDIFDGTIAEKTNLAGISGGICIYRFT